MSVQGHQRRLILVALALACTLFSTIPSYADSSLDVKNWLARPGVKLLAVEFYSVYCGPCMKAVPRWKRLHEKYQPRGLRFVVVSADTGVCSEPPDWNPDDVVCDSDRLIQDSWKVDGLPQAFLWSWQGNLLVSRGHVDNVESAIEAYFRRVPRILVSMPKDHRGRPLKNGKTIRDDVRRELARAAKFELLADKAEAKELRVLKEESHGLGKDSKLICRLGQEVSANSHLNIKIISTRRGKNLVLELLSIEGGCLTASSKAPIVSGNVDLAVVDAVTKLVSGLVEFQEPRMASNVSMPQQSIKERRIGPTGDEWRAEDEGQLVLVQFKSNPSGATVTVDKRTVCDRTPCQKALSSGPHRVEMQLEDYLPKSEPVTVFEGSPVSFDLEPNFAIVSVSSKPSGLPITIDGQKRGSTPLPDQRLGAGAHELLIDDGCHHQVGQTIQVERGQKRDVMLETRERKAGLKVFARDADGNDLEADVFVDGQKLGGTLRTHTVPLCSRELRIVHSGLRDYSLSLSGPVLAERQVATVTATLGDRSTTGRGTDLKLPQGVRSGLSNTGDKDWRAVAGLQLSIVYFESKPAGATVSVDGQTLCQSTPCSRAITPGRHRVLIRKARYVEQPGSLEVRAGEPRTNGSYTLEPDFGIVDVTSEPSGLPVFMDGKEIGATPLFGLELGAGAHRVMVKDRCHLDEGEEFVLKRGERRTLKFNPKERKAGIQVVAKAEKGRDVRADVYVDAKKVGSAPGSFTVPLCSSRVEVRDAKLGSWSQDLSLEEKKTTKLDAKLGGQAGMEWVTIAGGTFMMGSNRGDSDEKPVHRVTVSTFQMAKTEVTVGQYRACVKAGACTDHHLEGYEWPGQEFTKSKYCNWGKRGRDDHPINCVDWHQANAFAKWAGGRLPTEAQWEYAARGGGRDRKYPWGDAKADCSRAVMNDGGNGCGKNSTWPVCSKTRGNTEQGLCDMAGNVWEWCRDWYGSDYYGSSPSKDPVGPSTGSVRVIRGGSWRLFARHVRAAGRSWIDPGVRDSLLGFRPVRSIR